MGRKGNQGSNKAFTYIGIITVIAILVPVSVFAINYTANAYNIPFSIPWPFSTTTPTPPPVATGQYSATSSDLR